MRASAAVSRLAAGTFLILAAAWAASPGEARSSTPLVETTASRGQAAPFGSCGEEPGVLGDPADTSNEPGSASFGGVLPAAEPGDPATPGALRVAQRNGTFIDMPLQHTSVAIEVSAFVARATIEQTFANPFDHPIEAVYTFPLGDRAAVDDFRLVVGSRVVRGEIKRREEARQVYEAARAEGYQAALLEQERPNIFTQSVANLEPGKTICVRIRTVETLVYERAIYRLTFPLVVGPRYIPGESRHDSGTVGAAARTTPSAASRFVPQPEVGKESGKAVEIDESQDGAAQSGFRVPDMAGIRPPVLAPEVRSGHDVSITVSLDAGVPLTSLSSPSHTIVIERPSPTRAHVRLSPLDTIPNKDFLLRWSVASETPSVGLLAHRRGNDGFFTLLVQPKGEVSAEDAAPKEIVLVVDTSGSMSGIPLEASKRFIHKALKEMGRNDTFNLVRFAGDNEVFARSACSNLGAEVDRGLAWVDRMSGGGGTEMMSALETALAQPADPKRLRMVIFLTDGYVGNEDEILAKVAQAGEASTRVYTVGIGTSVNHALLSRMAELGNGAYVFIRPDERADEAIESFRSWVTRPYLTDLSIDWGTLDVADVSPETLRDLGSGQTLALVGRYLNPGRSEVVVRGKLAGRYWEHRLTVDLPEIAPRHAALASLWARGRIEKLLMQAPGAVPDSTRAEVTSLALAYRLMSPYTSFVAVDDSRIVNSGGTGPTVAQALPMPEGVSFEGVFGAAGPAALQVAAPMRASGRARHGGDDISEKSGDANRAIARTTLTDAIQPKAPEGAGAPASDARDRDGAGGGAAPETLRQGSKGDHKSRDVGSVIGGVVGGVLGAFAEEPNPAPPMAAAGTAAPERLSLHGGFGSREGAAAIPTKAKVVELSDPSGEAVPNQWFADWAHTQGTGTLWSSIPEAGAAMVEGTTGRRPGGAGSSSTRATSPGSERVLDMALRLLADLADDGQLTMAEGRPALAGLLGAQTFTGALSDDVRVHAVAAWALAEAAVKLPRERWVVAASKRATSYLEGLETTAGWPAWPDDAPDPETTRWALWALRVARPDQPAHVSAPTRAPSAEYSKLRKAIVEGRTGVDPVDHPARRTAFDRLCAFIGHGNLRITHVS